MSLLIFSRLFDQGIFGELIYDYHEDLGDLKIKSDVFPSNTIYIRKPLYALVEINTSQLETSLDGLPPKIIPIPLIKKQFTIPIKQLFGRLIERVQGGKKSFRDNPSYKNSIANRTCLRNNYL
jgi:hypothetical protein